MLLRPLLALALLLGAACTKETQAVRPDFDASQYRTVAVLDFVGEAGEEDLRGLVAGGAEEAMIQCGLDVIDRGQVHKLKQERGDQDIDYKALGKLLGVDLFVTGAGHFQLGGVVEITYRGIDSQSGRVLFSGSLGSGGKAEGNGRIVGGKVCSLFRRGDGR